MRRFFVTGTDTGVGKTAVSAALLAAASARGMRTACLKPAESGCERRDGELVPADALLLARAAGYEVPVEQVCPYRFEAAVAPGVAAEGLGTVIDFGRIERALQTAMSRRPELLVVEGAGGLLVPFGGGRLLADLIVRLELPLLVVARAGLGTINHTLLTIEAARARQVRVAGVILSEVEPEDPELVASNAREIERASGAAVWGVLPHLEHSELSALATSAEQSGLLDALLRST